MQLSETVKLYMTKTEYMLVKDTMDTYISTVKSIVSDAVNGTSIAKLTSKGVSANLPSALRNQCARDARSIAKKYNMDCIKANRKNAKFAKQGKNIMVAATLPVLKKPCCYVNNQNFRVSSTNIEFPVMVDGKSKRLFISTRMTDRQRSLFASYKLGAMRIVIKDNRIVVQILYDVNEFICADQGNIMGVDLGIKCSAVSKCSDGSVKFYSNGRKNNLLHA